MFQNQGIWITEVAVCLAFANAILLPCTENVNQQDLDTATDILRQATPPGYTINTVVPTVCTGRNPHRWVVSYSRNDNVYEAGCAFLTAIKKDFKRYCPQGSEVRMVMLTNQPNQLNQKLITVEFLVNCYCTNVVRRKRSWRQCNKVGYTREPATCF